MYYAYMRIIILRAADSEMSLDVSYNCSRLEIVS